MNVEILMQYITYALMAIGVLAFLVAVIVQVLKELPWLQRIPTSVVALTVSLILCLLAVIIAWYYVLGSFIAAFIVYPVATGGWERVAEMWRTLVKGTWHETDPHHPSLSGGH